MKNLLLVLAMFSSVFFVGCEKDDTDTRQLNTALQDGNWRITHFSESGVNETNHFSGYTFTFKPDGTVAAAKAGATTINGTWSSVADSGHDKLILIFATTANSFDELSEDWHVRSRTATKIELEHVSGGNGGTDLLTFEKN